MNNENILTEGQEVWISARIVNPEPDFDGDIMLRTTASVSEEREVYCLPTEIRTTEQILMEEAIKNDLKSDKFRVYIDDVRQGLNYYYLYAPDGTEHVYPKECFSPREVIEICDAENAKIASQNAKPTTISKPETVTETPHFDEKTPHNAELPDQNAECWVRAKYIEKNDFGNLIELNDGSLNKRTHIQDSDLHFTKPQTQEIIFTEPDRTRKFRKGDKVRLVERWGRPLREGELFESWAFKPNEVYEVSKDEEDSEVELTNGEYSWYYPFYFLDLVEPAPEPKYWLHESPKTYSIYYKGQFGRVITAMLLRKDIYTLEEARQECERLNSKDQDND